MTQHGENIKEVIYHSTFLGFDLLNISRAQTVPSDFRKAIVSSDSFSWLTTHAFH